MSSLFHRLSRTGTALLLLAGGIRAQAADVFPTLPPVPPGGPASLSSPVVYFRQLLAAPPQERERLLAGKSPQQLRVLTNSIRTYLALSDAEREVRLRTMELSSILAPLLRLAPGERIAKLNVVPAEFRPAVEQRLAYWDRLNTNVQQLLIANDKASRVPVRLLIPTPPIPTNVPAGMESILAPWKGTTPARQEEAMGILSKLSDPTPGLRKKTLDPLPLSPTERVLIEKALETFRQMPPAQRQACVSGFKRFAELPPAERIQFFRNAEAWQKMAPEDRQRWRDIVNRMPPPPPLPPGFGLPPTPQPPRASIGTSSLFVSNSPPQ